MTAHEAPLGLMLPRCAIARFGAEATTILAGALVYAAHKDPTATIVRGDGEWLDLAGLTRRQVQRARARLRHVGWVDYELRVNNGAPIPHYQLTGDLHIEVQRLHLQVQTTSISRRARTSGGIVGQRSIFVQPTRRDYDLPTFGCNGCSNGWVLNDDHTTQPCSVCRPAERVS